MAAAYGGRESSHAAHDHELRHRIQRLTRIGIRQATQRCPRFIDVAAGAIARVLDRGAGEDQVAALLHPVRLTALQQAAHQLPMLTRRGAQEVNDRERELYLLDIQAEHYADVAGVAD